MPLPGYLRKSMDTDSADVANMGEPSGGMLVAGHFLREFVPNGVAWAHLDIAGPAFNEASPFGYTPKGGTVTVTTRADGDYAILEVEDNGPGIPEAARAQRHLGQVFA